MQTSDLQILHNYTLMTLKKKNAVCLSVAFYLLRGVNQVRVCLLFALKRCSSRSECFTDTPGTVES